MQRIARTLRYLANRYLADPDRKDRDQPNQHIARTNAAKASATLRQRRHEQEDADAYVHARRRIHRAEDTEDIETSRGRHGTEPAL
jgi:hypothetical protein